MGGIRDISEQQWGACPWDTQDAQVDECYAYDSTWKLVAHPEDTLPDLVVTTQGTRQKAERNEVESINDIRTFAVPAHLAEVSLSLRLRVRIQRLALEGPGATRQGLREGPQLLRSGVLGLGSSAPREERHEREVDGYSATKDAAGRGAHGFLQNVDVCSR